MGCYQPAGSTVPTGGEVAFRFRPQQMTNLKFSVRSLSPGFTPAIYLTLGTPTCASAIAAKECSANLLAQVYREAPDLFVLVGGTTGSEGEFELLIEATPMSTNEGGGSAGGGSTAGGTSQGGGRATGGGGSGAGAAPAVTARALWDSQSDVRDLATKVRDYHLGVIRFYAGIARRAAGATNLVFSGTLTETATDVYQYSATPSDRLLVNRLTGAPFSFTVQSLVGDLSDTSFPGPDENVSFVFRHSGGSLTGTVSQVGRASAQGATRRLTFQGISWTSSADTELSTIDIRHTELVDIYTEVVTLRTSSGSLSNSQRSLSWSLRADSWTCSSCTPTLLHQRSYEVTSTVGGRTFVLDYVDELIRAPNSNMALQIWNGTIKERGTLVGGFARNLVSGSTYALDINLGSSSHTTRVTQSRP